jgi:DNA-binding HxlR family transcriptional regulator
MQRKSFETMDCPIARSLERVGEWWSMLILRDAFAGRSRFDEFQKSLGIAPTMLTRRLNGLVEAGLLERHRYSEKPPRDEYRLTPRGMDFRPVLLALLAWGNRHFAPEGETIMIVDTVTQQPIEPMLVDRTTGRPLMGPAYAVVPGPAASDSLRRRMAGGSQMLRPDPAAPGGAAA